jgi:hypothetical protein
MCNYKARNKISIDLNQKQIYISDQVYHTVHGVPLGTRDQEIMRKVFCILLVLLFLNPHSGFPQNLARYDMPHRGLLSTKFPCEVDTLYTKEFTDGFLKTDTLGFKTQIDTVFKDDEFMVIRHINRINIKQYGYEAFIKEGSVWHAK